MLFPPQVSVPMKFNGTAGVQVRTPSNLADLAAYTSLKFHITLPETSRKRRQDSNRQFVFYLGNKNVSTTRGAGLCCVVLSSIYYFCRELYYVG